MELFNVYPRFDITLKRGQGDVVWDVKGKEYLDLYGGHAVISVGHNHPTFTSSLKKQVDLLPYYSNSVHLPKQKQLAERIGKISGYDSYQLFLCNSGAEANENALKLASFHTGKKKVIYFSNAFHGRTAGALAVTDNAKIRSPFNESYHGIRIPMNDSRILEQTLRTEEDIAAVIFEPLQGVSGIYGFEEDFIQKLQNLCKEKEILLIADEIQSGCGRTGKYFAHQWHSNLKPDLITMAKGMGNGFPIGGVLINSKIEASAGLLGTTFGGNPLACMASIAVHKVLEKESLVDRALKLEQYLRLKLKNIPQIKEIRGRGLMLGLEFDFPIKEMRQQLVYDYGILTGNAKQPNTLRLLPALTVKKKSLKYFIKSLKDLLETNTYG